MPVQDMVATPEKLEQMAGGGDPSIAAAGGGGGEGSIGQVDPMGGMAAAGEPGPPKMGFDSSAMNQMGQQATALSAVLNRVNGN
jgi:hypothetical protein